MRWVIFYGDGTLVSSELSTWDDAPAEDAQIVMKYFDAPYREVIMGEDVLDPLTDPRLAGFGTQPKYGRLLPDDEFNALVEIAMNMVEFPDG